jgi:hypothetical protein
MPKLRLPFEKRVFTTLRHRAYIFTGGQRLNFDMPGK